MWCFGCCFRNDGAVRLVLCVFGQGEVVLVVVDEVVVVVVAEAFVACMLDRMGVSFTRQKRRGEPLLRT